MKKTAFALALAAAAGLGTAQAQDYQMELEAGYSDFNPDVGEGDSAFDVAFTYYLDRVATAGRPLAEAAFLANASNLGIGYLTFDDADADAIGVNGEFWFNQLYLNGSYTAAEIGNVDVDTIGVRAGWMLMPNLRIAAGVDRTDVDVPGAEETDDIVVEGKYVADLGGGMALNVEGSVTFLDDPADDEVFEVAADYYLNPAFSIGAGGSFADQDDNFLLRARYFVTPAIAGQVEYFTQNDGDDDVFRVSGLVRF
ncbi:putative porin [Sinimarinibacterium thermocellulolyticum]|uniref:Porin n=1 Tax=Sinimarinibacterium thermocellulolyticum TaxID=3170016 RepID=A0ABV2ACS7_9GAMM